jgi:hypothetical protein
MRTHRRRRAAVAVTGVLVVVLAAALGIVATVGAEPPHPVLGAVALAAVVAAPGVLALLGLDDRPDLWLAAGWTAFPFALISFAGLTLPLLGAMAVFLWAWITRPNLPIRPRVPTAVVAPLVFLLAAAAASVLLFGPDDPTSWTNVHGGSGHTSDVITQGEALACLGLLALALAAGWLLTKPTASGRG